MPPAQHRPQARHRARRSPTAGPTSPSPARARPAGLLIATGAYTLWQARGGPEAEIGEPGRGPTWGRLLLSALALSVDNLAVGFSLGSYRVGLVTAAVVIGAVSVALTLVGLELGGRIGAAAGQRGEYVGGVILIGVGVAVAAGAL